MDKVQNHTPLQLNSLPNDKILDCSNLKVFANNTIHVTENLKFVFGRVKKHCGKQRKCWLPASSPLPTMFSKGSLYLRGVGVGLVCVVKGRDCVVKS